MPLNTAGLTSDLIELAQNPPGVYAGETVDVSATFAACGQAWGNIMRSYASGIAPPSSTVTAASGVLASSLTSAFSTSNIAAISAAFTAFAGAVGLGMAPAFTATPPPSPPNFAGLMTTNVATHVEGGTRFAVMIDAWMRTGTAVSSTSGPPAIPWS